MLTAILVLQIVLLAIYVVNAVAGIIVAVRSDRRARRDQAEHERWMATMNASLPPMSPIPRPTIGLVRDGANRILRTEDT
jgi:hypothetical protein